MTHYMKLLSLFACLLCVHSAAAQSLRKLLTVPLHMIEVKWERDAQEATELNYYNHDYCDYYLYLRGAQPCNLEPGKNTVYRKQKNSQVDNPLSRSANYRYYRGKFPKDFRIDTPYALPVKPGKKTGWQTDRRESMKTMNFRIHEGDTVCATRGGVVCQTEHPKHVLIYHADCTFAAYLLLAERLVQPGETVTVGQPVGVAGNAGAPISYFFLDKNKFQGDLPAGYCYSHFVPMFRTEQGSAKPAEKTYYQAVLDDELVTLDMSKREKKKYLQQQQKKGEK